MTNETDKLRSEFIGKIEKLNQTVKQLENRISALENHDQSISQNANLETSIPPASTDANKPIISSTSTNTNQTTNNEDALTAAKNTRDTSKNEPLEPALPVKPGINPFAGLIEIIIMLFGPFGSVLHQVLRVYHRYQEQGRGPAFLMTAAGILALVMGFGFLLQYSFSNYLGTGGKIGTGFITAIAMVVLGMKISNKRTMLSEFGAALIGLGIILNYLCAYFISGHFNIVGPTVGLGLLAVITFTAYWLAVHYDTKTVAILSLMGGASTPLFLGDLTQVSTVYFIYLTFLVATMLHLAHKIKWPNLIQFTLIITIAMTQYLFFEQGGKHLINNTLFIVLLHILFYLFSYACVHHISKLESKIDKPILLTIVGNIIFFVFVLYQSISVDNYLGLTYLINAAALLLFYKFNWLLAYASKEIKNDFNALIILQIGLLIGFGALYLVSPSLLGLIWGVEGLALVYVGFRFSMPSIRFEGHFAFLIGMGSAAIEAFLWLEGGVIYNFGSNISIGLSYDTGWMNLIVFGLVLWLAARLLQHNLRQCLEFEKTACLWSHELFSIWLSLAFMVSLLVITSDSLLLLSIVPLFILLYRAKKYQLPLTEILGLAHYFLFILQVFISAVQVDSFSLSQQNWVGIAVRVEAFVTLWLIAEFYKQFYPKSKFAGFAESLRITFYVLIPLLAIPKIIKSYDEFLPLALWFSATLALMLFSKLKYKALKIEFYILVALAWFMTIVASATNYINIWDVYADYALFSGLVFFAVTSSIWKAYTPEYQLDNQNKTSNELYGKIKDYIHLHHWSVYYLATTIFILMIGFTENFTLSILSCSIYFTALCFVWPKVVPAKISLGLSYSFVIGLSFVTLILINILGELSNTIRHDTLLPLYLIIQTAFIGFLLHKNIPSSERIRNYMGGYISQLWIFNVFLIFTYTSVINFWLPDQLRILLSILLVLHAAAILMLTLKDGFEGLLKLSVILFVGSAIKILMFDMVDFSLVQKIIAFMIIGAMLLGASYLYQKVQQKTNVDSINDAV